MRINRVRRWLGATGAIAALALAALAGTALGSTQATTPAPGDWVAWGRTPDNLRYSPLTGITPDNAAQLGRAYTIDFRTVDPDIRAGNQSYPLAIDGVLYVKARPRPARRRRSTTPGSCS